MSFLFIDPQINDIEIFQKGVKVNSILIHNFDTIANMKNLLNTNAVNMTNVGIVYENKTEFQQHTIPMFNDTTLNGEMFEEFVKTLATLKVKHIDLITCDVKHMDDVARIQNLEAKYAIDIRYSVDQTGNQQYNGNWIMESDGVNIHPLYFNEEISKYTHILGNGSRGYLHGFIVNNQLYMGGPNNFGIIGRGGLVSDGFGGFRADRGVVLPYELASGFDNVKCMSCLASSYGVITTISGNVYTSGHPNLSEGVWRPYQLKTDISNVVMAVATNTGVGLNAGAIALTNNGDLYTWQLQEYVYNGLARTDMLTSSVTKRTDISNVIFIGSAFANKYAIDKNNDLYVAGANGGSGMLGLGPVGNVTTFTKVPDISNVKYVAGDDYAYGCTLAVLNDGTVWGTGNGITRYGVSSNSGYFQQIPNITNAKSVHCGDNHTAILCNDGTVYICGIWGFNDNSVTTYTQVDISNVDYVYAGYGVTYFVTPEDGLYYVGRSMLGNFSNNTANGLTPRKLNDNLVNSVNITGLMNSYYPGMETFKNTMLTNPNVTSSQIIPLNVNSLSSAGFTAGIQSFIEVFNKRYNPTASRTFQMVMVKRDVEVPTRYQKITLSDEILENVTATAGLYLPLENGVPVEIAVSNEEIRVTTNQVAQTVTVEYITTESATQTLTIDETFTLNGINLKVIGIGGLGLVQGGGGAIPCFLGNTKILTPSGYKQVQSLKNGDLVVTTNKEIVPIRIHKTFVESSTLYNAPFLIPKNFISKNLPCHNVFVSPQHMISLDGGEHWISPRMLNSRLSQVHLGKPVVYYHIETPNYFNDNLIASNLMVESYGQNVKQYVSFTKTPLGYTRHDLRNTLVLVRVKH